MVLKTFVQEMCGDYENILLLKIFVIPILFLIHEIVSSISSSSFILSQHQANIF